MPDQLMNIRKARRAMRKIWTKRQNTKVRRAARAAVSGIACLALAVQFPLGALSSALAEEESSGNSGLEAVASDEEVAALLDALSTSDADTGEWTTTTLAAGTGEIDTAGVYRLSDDIERADTLKVSVPEGQVVVIDLNGHDFKVSGSVNTAIDASGSLGTLAVIDSSRDEDGDSTAGDDDTASIVLETTASADAAPDAVAVRCQVSDDAHSKLADGDQAAVVLDGVELGATRGQGTTVSTTSALEVSNAHAYLGSDVTFADLSQDGDLDLSSGHTDEFTFLKGFSFDRVLSISCAAAQDGAVFAHAADAVSEKSAKKLGFSVYGSAGLTCSYGDERQYLFSTVPQEDSTSQDTSSSSAQSASASASARSLSILSSSSSTESRTDLNAVWEDTSSSYTISSSGTYYLSDDLTTTARLIIDADAGRVELDFEGHTLESSSANGTAINITAAKKVTLKGDDSRTSTLSLTGNKLTNAIYSSADSLYVEGLTVNCSFSSRYLTQTDLAACALSVQAGTLDLENSTLNVDLSNQGNTETSSNNAVKNGPQALVIGDDAGAALVSGSSILVTNSKVVGVSDESDVTSVGFAEGVYSTSSSALTLEGDSISVSSALGTAIGVYAKNAQIDGDDAVSVTADASDLAIGLYAAAESGFTLDAPYSFTNSNDAVEYSAALYGSVDNAFVFEGGFSSEDTLAAWVGDSTDTANDDGDCLGTMSDSLDAAARAELVSGLSNALGSDAACTLVQSGDRIVFQLDENAAEAAVVDGSSVTYYARVGTAVDALEAGQTLRLLKDASSVSLSKSDTTGTFTIDLYGNKLSGLTLKGAASYSIVSSVDGGVISNESTGSYAITCSGTGSVDIERVEVDAVSSSREVAAIYSSSKASFSLTDVTITASSSRSSSYAVRITSTSAGSLTVSGGSISSFALVSGVSAYGVSDSSKSGDVSIASCPITVVGASSTAYGISVNSNLDLAGRADTTSVSVSTDSASSSVAGVRLGSSSEKARLDTASVSVSGPEDASSYWCLGTSSSSADPVWEMTGTTSLYSSTGTEIRHSSSALVLDAGFSLAGSTVHVSTLSSDLEDFASVDDSLDAGTLATQFAPVADSIFDGCTVEAKSSGGNTSLSWVRPKVVYDSRTGNSYSTLAAAVSGASAGDTLVLTADLTERSGVEISKNLTLDVQGHKFVMEVGSDEEGVAVSAGTFTVKDSSEGKTGAVSVHLGASTEKSATTYQGFAVSSGARLVFDDVAVSVAYTGSSTKLPSVTLEAVAVSGGAFKMTSGSSLQVQSAAEDDTFGATEVYGIWADDTTGASISVPEGASVTVTNNSEQIESGASDYPDSTSSVSTTTVNLIELELTEGSDLYNEIQDAFLENAKFDSSSDTVGKVYSDNVYYLSAYELSSGLTIWACSDSVSSSDAGKLESIKATHVFIRAPYDIANDAYGISADEDFTGTVEIQGNLSVTTGEGIAVGIDELAESATWTVDEANVSATADTDSMYLARASKKMDLSDYIDMGDYSVDDVSYPKDSTYFAVSAATPQALSVRTSDSDDQATSSSLSESNFEEALYPQMSNDSIQVTFSNLYDESGNIETSVTQSVAYGTTLQEQGNDQVTPSDYTRGNITYRFVGWKVSGDSTVYCRDADELYSSLAFDSNVSGVTSGAVSLSAVYVPVQEGQSLVSFNVDGRVVAYAVDEGDSVRFEDCYNSSGALAPSKIDTEDGYTFTFAGWTVEGSTDSTTYAALPRASGDVCYTASFTKTITPTSLTTRYRTLTNGEYAETTDVATVDDWTQSISSILSEYGNVGDTCTNKGTIYTLKGWSPRMSDVEPLYTSNDITISVPTGSFSSMNYLFGVYDTEDQMVTVNVYSNGSLVASSDNIAASTTISKALSSMGVDSSKLTPPSDDVEFRGWNTSADASTILTTSLTTVGSACDYGDELNLYSIWRTKRYLVTLYDSDRKTIVGKYYVNKGETLEESNSDFELSLTGKKKDTFKGWVDEDGNAFSTSDTVVTKDLDVYAVYETRSKGNSKLTSNKTPSPSGSISTSGGLTDATTPGVDDVNSSSASAKKTQAAAAAGTGQDGSSTASDDSGAWGSRIALAVAAALAALGLLFLVLWLFRRKREDKAPEPLSSARERIHF